MTVSLNPSMNAPAALIADLLEWLAAAPRPYEEVMAGWRTSCPRLPVWEDALDAGYVKRETRDGAAIVAVTQAGRAFLRAQRAGAFR